MKLFFIILTSVFLTLISVGSGSMAADIQYGWSGQATIALMRSEFTVTAFRLDGASSGCGDSEWWLLPMDPTDYGRFKRASLLAAFVAGKKVDLRCEGSRVSDFVVYG